MPPPPPPPPPDEPVLPQLPRSHPPDPRTREPGAERRRARGGAVPPGHLPDVHALHRAGDADEPRHGAVEAVRGARRARRPRRLSTRPAARNWAPIGPLFAASRGA